MTDFKYFSALIWMLLIGYLLYIFNQLAFFDQLASLANDSANYLVMARHYSPWFEETTAIKQVWGFQDFPPLFPLLLAITGSSHSFLAAHGLVILLGIVSLFFLYKFSLKTGLSSVYSYLVVIIFSLSPGFILGLQGILSESLFLLLSLVFLHQYQQAEKFTYLKVIILGLILASVLLTRTAGYALLLGLACHGVVASVINRRLEVNAFYVAAAGLVIYSLVMWFIGPERDSHYQGVLIHFLSGDNLMGVGSGYQAAINQIVSLLEAWQTFWLIYWLDENSVTYWIMLIFLALAFMGLFYRLRRNSLDAWYVTGSIVMLLLWPAPGQMVRFIFPVVPIMVLYAIFIIFWPIKRTSISIRRNVFIQILGVGLLLSSVLPAHAFILGRIKVISDSGELPVYEAFRRADASLAERDVYIQNQIFRDIQAVKKYTEYDDRVMYFVPSYIALLSDRQAVKAPYPVKKDIYRKISEEKAVKYIFISKIHPRNTRKGTDGLSGSHQLASFTTELWCSKEKETGIKASCLYLVTP